MDEPPRKRTWGRTFRRAALLFVFIFGGIIGAALIWHPDSRFPNQWNPATHLVVTDPMTPLTGWKLRRTLADPAACLAAVEAHASVIDVTPIVSENPNCGVDQSVIVGGIGRAQLMPLQTACSTALKTALWEHHVLQPAAQGHFGSYVKQIDHQGSYNCRPMRTSSGSATRWSTHATAAAVDVRSFVLASGERITLLQDWNGDDVKARFLRDVRDGACGVFGTVLGPDYNRLHADHFHLQVRGWGTCR